MRGEGGNGGERAATEPEIRIQGDTRDLFTGTNRVSGDSSSPGAFQLLYPVIKRLEQVAAVPF